MIETIYILWFQGFNNAPELVKRCVNSWKYYNPSWNIILIDNNNLINYINLNNYINIKFYLQYFKYISGIGFENPNRFNFCIATAAAFCSASCFFAAFPVPNNSVVLP